MPICPPFRPYDGEEPFIFISYAHQDREMVFPILSHLDGQGFRIWYDEGVDPGTEWPEEIAAHLLACTVFMLFTTPDSMRSSNVRREINMAVKHEKRLLNVMLMKTELTAGMDMQLSLIQYLTYSQEDESGFFERLTRVLAKLGRETRAVSDSARSRDTSEHEVPPEEHSPPAEILPATHGKDGLEQVADKANAAERTEGAEAVRQHLGDAAPEEPGSSADSAEEKPCPFWKKAVKAATVVALGPVALPIVSKRVRGYLAETLFSSEQGGKDHPTDGAALREAHSGDSCQADKGEADAAAQGTHDQSPPRETQA